MSIEQVNPRLGRFNTILMLGNNFGLFHNPRMAETVLRKLWQTTSPTARIIAESLDPYPTKDPFHLAYHRLNKRRGRMPGQVRIRIRYRKYCSPWFDYLLVSKPEMREIVDNTGWRIGRFILTRNQKSSSRGQPYVERDD